MALLPTDVMIGAFFTASSFDNTSDACRGNKCIPSQVGNDGTAREGDDTTFWQSSQDPTCANQWIQADFAQPYPIQNFTIEYASLGNLFSRTNKHFQVLLNPSSDTTRDVTGITTCTTKNMTDTDGLERYDTCSMPYLQLDVTGIRFIWGLDELPGTKYCQMNVDEIVINSFVTVVKETKTANPFSPAGSPVPEHKVDMASQPGISVGIAVGIAIVGVIAVLVAVLVVIRQRNLAKRKRSGRFHFVELTTETFDD